MVVLLVVVVVVVGGVILVLIVVVVVAGVVCVGNAKPKTSQAYNAVSFPIGIRGYLEIYLYTPEYNDIYFLIFKNNHTIFDMFLNIQQHPQILLDILPFCLFVRPHFSLMPDHLVLCFIIEQRQELGHGVP